MWIRGGIIILTLVASFVGWAKEKKPNPAFYSKLKAEFVTQVEKCFADYGARPMILRPEDPEIASYLKKLQKKSQSSATTIADLQKYAREEFTKLHRDTRGEIVHAQQLVLFDNIETFSISPEARAKIEEMQQDEKNWMNLTTPEFKVAFFNFIGLLAISPNLLNEKLTASVRRKEEEGLRAAQDFGLGAPEGTNPHLSPTK
jgi:hypothetical protein